MRNTVRKKHFIKYWIRKEWEYVDNVNLREEEEKEGMRKENMKEEEDEDIEKSERRKESQPLLRIAK